jgi:hypothetical protein
MKHALSGVFINCFCVNSFFVAVLRINFQLGKRIILKLVFISFNIQILIKFKTNFENSKLNLKLRYFYLISDVYKSSKNQIFTPITHTSSTCSKFPFHWLKKCFKALACSLGGDWQLATNKSQNCLYFNFLPFGPPN